MYIRVYFCIIMMVLDINECYTSNNGGCSGDCINTDGAYHCAEGMWAVFIM